MARPSPAPCPVALPPRWKRSKTRSSSPGGDSRSTVGDLEVEPRRVRLWPGRGPPSRAACGARRSRAGSPGAAPPAPGRPTPAPGRRGSRSGRGGGRGGPRSGRGPRRRSRPPGSTPAAPRPPRRRAGSCRAGSRPAAPSARDSSQMASTSSRRVPSSTAWSRSVVAAPVMAASGVRRSWDTDESRVPRSASDSARTAASRARSASELTRRPIPNIMAKVKRYRPSVDVQREGRRDEEVVVGEHADGRRGDGRSAPEVDGGDQDREHVEHLDVRHVEHRPGGRADGGGPEHERHRPGVAEPARPAPLPAIGCGRGRAGHRDMIAPLDRPHPRRCFRWSSARCASSLPPQRASSLPSSSRSNEFTSSATWARSSERTILRAAGSFTGKKIS